MEVWDFDAARKLALRQKGFARETGALVQLRFALSFRAGAQYGVRARPAGERAQTVAAAWL